MTSASDSRAASGLVSLLFVPGSRPDWIGKALSSDASAICIDLEDAVAAGRKEEARYHAVAAIGPRVAIRINAMRTRSGLADLLALAAAPALPDLVLVPMVASPIEIEIVASVLGPGAEIVPLIETTTGLANAAAIAGTSRVVAMMFGGGDLSAELGVELAWEPLAVARAMFVLACAGAGVPAIDVPFLGLDDVIGLADETRRAKAAGFQAKAALHPSQLAAINETMLPTSGEIAEAREAMAAFAAGGGGAIRFKGRMLEAPVVRRFARILAMARSMAGVTMEIDDA